MSLREAADVARRCLCLELLLQRLGLEADTEDPAATREGVRAKWAARLGDLGVDGALLPVERALLERPVGTLGEDDLDELHGRATGAVVLLWALGRLEARPTFASFDDMEAIVADHGLLGAGSIVKARAAADGARLREKPDLVDAASTYARARGKAREPSDPEKIVAGIAAHHLDWILDAGLPFDDA